MSLETLHCGFAVGAKVARGQVQGTAVLGQKGVVVVQLLPQIDDLGKGFGHLAFGVDNSNEPRTRLNIPEPPEQEIKLLADEFKFLREHNAAEAKKLNAYSWINKPSGTFSGYEDY